MQPLYPPPNALTVFVFFIAMQEERGGSEIERVFLSSRPAGAASKDPNQVGIDTTVKPSRATSLKSSEFRTYAKQHLRVDTTGVQQQQQPRAQPRFLKHLCLSKVPHYCSSPRGLLYRTSMFMFAHQHRFIFSQTTPQSPVRAELLCGT